MTVKLLCNKHHCANKSSRFSLEFVVIYIEPTNLKNKLIFLRLLVKRLRLFKRNEIVSILLFGVFLLYLRELHFYY